jgi:RimJ/RimL family protein N-acetyltransferase
VYQWANPSARGAAMVLETKRLVVRSFVASDLAQFEKLLDIPEVVGWQMQKGNPQGFLDWHISNYQKMDIVNGIVCFGIFDKQSGCVLGAVGAGEHDDLHEPEIFYNLLPDARGKGYATEAAKAVTEWVFANYDVEYLIGTVEVGNIRSQRVLENCGYQFIGEKTLLVHIEKKRYTFRYYRRYNRA